MPPVSGKTFNIPFSGGVATVVCLFKYTTATSTASEDKSTISAQYNADGTTVTFWGSSGASLSVSVNNGVMTVILRTEPGSIVTDCRCCLIPGDPFA